MLNNKILSTFCDPEFALVSLGEYSDRSAQRYGRVLELMQGAINADHEYLPSEAQGVVSSAGFAWDAYVPVGKDRLPLWQYLVTLSASANDDTITDLLDVTPNGSSYTMYEVVDHINADMHSVSAFAAALKAKAADGVDSVQLFYSQLSQKWANAYDDLSGTASQFAAMLTSKLDNVSFLASAISLLGVASYADSSSTEPDTYQNDISDLTGASPIGPLDFSGVCETVNAVASVGAAIVGGVFSAVKSMVAYGVGAAVDYVTETVILPDDLDVTNIQGGKATVDKFCWVGKDVTLTRNYSTATTPLGLANFDLCSRHWNATYGYQGMLNRWIKWDFLFAEVLIRPKRVTWDYSTHDFIMQCDYQFKPKVIDPIVFDAAIDALPASGTPTSKWEAFAAYLSQNGCYLMKADSERLKFRGLLYGLQLMLNATWACFGQTFEGSTDATLPHKMTLPAEDIKNKHFAYLACGPLGNLSLPTGINVYPEQMPQSIAELAMLYFLSLADAWANPLDATWIPYANGTTTFSPSGWRIKTDSENIEACTNFLTAVVITVVVVALAVLTGIVLTKITRAVFFRRKQLQSVLQAKMNSGQKLTRSEQAQFVRATRKLNASTYLSAATSKKPQQNEPIDLDSIYNVIVGTPSD